MASVEISLGGRRYAFECGSGEEDRVRALAARLSREMPPPSDAAKSGEAMTLVMAAIAALDRSDEDIRRFREESSLSASRLLDAAEALRTMTERLESALAAVESDADAESESESDSESEK